MLKPDISIVIIEYFSLDDISYCISNIALKLDSISYEIIVSSNSCYSEEEQIDIRKKIPNAIWTFNEKNGGFAYGMNQGLALSRGKYLIIANPDVIILDGFSEMVTFMDSNQNVGAIGPKIIDEKGILQDSCRPYISVWKFLSRQMKRVFFNKTIVYEKDFDYDKIQTVDWIIGAFIMVRREVFEIAGGLDENYFLYVEDLDWCSNIRQCGFEIVYYPKMIIQYKGSRAARKKINYTTIYLRSQLTFWKKFGYFSGFPVRNEIAINS